MKIYVVRHGETEYNSQGRYAGSTDVPLNGNGLRQAEQLAEKFAGIKFDIIVSSPLMRAKRTAEMIQNTQKVPLVIIDQFAERNVGVYEGLTQDEAKVRYPHLFDRECTRRIDDAPTGGETIRQFDSRITTALECLKKQYPTDTILLVCHGFVSRIINRYYKGLSFDEMHSFTLGNCEIAEYTV